MLAVHLREAKHLTVGEGTAQTLGQLAQIVLLLFREGEAFTLVVFRDVGDMLDGGPLGGSG